MPTLVGTTPAAATLNSKERLALLSRRGGSCGLPRRMQSTELLILPVQSSGWGGSVIILGAAAIHPPSPAHPHALGLFRTVRRFEKHRRCPALVTALRMWGSRRLMNLKTRGPFLAKERVLLVLYTTSWEASTTEVYPLNSGARRPRVGCQPRWLLL